LGVYPHNLFPGPSNAHEKRAVERTATGGQPLVTRPELGLYTIRTLINALF
jgi:hypothetical protein